MCLFLPYSNWVEMWVIFMDLISINYQAHTKLIWPYIVKDQPSNPVFMKARVQLAQDYGFSRFTAILCLCYGLVRIVYVN